MLSSVIQPKNKNVIQIKLPCTNVKIQCLIHDHLSRFLFQKNRLEYGHMVIWSIDPQFSIKSYCIGGQTRGQQQWWHTHLLNFMFYGFLKSFSTISEFYHFGAESKTESWAESDFKFTIYIWICVRVCVCFVYTWKYSVIADRMGRDVDLGNSQAVSHYHFEKWWLKKRRHQRHSQTWDAKWISFPDEPFLLYIPFPFDLLSLAQIIFAHTHAKKTDFTNKSLWFQWLGAISMWNHIYYARVDCFKSVVMQCRWHAYIHTVRVRVRVRVYVVCSELS